MFCEKVENNGGITYVFKVILQSHVINSVKIVKSKDLTTYTEEKAQVLKDVVVRQASKRFLY